MYASLPSRRVEPQDRQTDGRTDGRAGGRAGRQTDRQTKLLLIVLDLAVDIFQRSLQIQMSVFCIDLKCIICPYIIN